VTKVLTPQSTDDELVDEARRLSEMYGWGPVVHVPLVSTEDGEADRAQVNLAGWPSITVRRYSDKPI